MNDHQFTTLGKTIRTLRKKLLLSQEGFADRCNLHRTYVSDVENGSRNVTLGTLLRIAQGLGITVSELTRNVELDAPPRDEAVAFSVRRLKVAVTVCVLFLAAVAAHAQSLLEGLDLVSVDAVGILQRQVDSAVSVPKKPPGAVLVSGSRALSQASSLNGSAQLGDRASIKPDSASATLLSKARTNFLATSFSAPASVPVKDWHDRVHLTLPKAPEAGGGLNLTSLSESAEEARAKK